VHKLLISESNLHPKGKCVNQLFQLFQEVLNDSPFSNLLKQVDGKNWRLHLQVNNRNDIQELKIAG
jgi:hypothetical protein